MQDEDLPRSIRQLRAMSVALERNAGYTVNPGVLLTLEELIYSDIERAVQSATKEQDNGTSNS